MKIITKIALYTCAAALLIACSDGGGSGSSSEDKSHFILATVDDMGDGSNVFPMILIVEGSNDQGTPVTGATVTVESSTLDPYILIPGCYVSGTTIIPQDIAFSGSIELSVNTSKVTVSEAQVLPEAPVITDPASDSSTHDVSDDLNLTWNALSVEPSYIDVTIEDSSESYYNMTLPGYATTCTIPGGTIRTGETSDITVTAINQKGLSGINVASGSTFICASGDTVSITHSPAP